MDATDSTSQKPNRLQDLSPGDLKKMATVSYSAPVVSPYSHHHWCDLFGGSKAWNITQWTAQDDRLRGGTSISHLTITPLPKYFMRGSPGTMATFHGNLDTTTLGGAGFASQRTVGDDVKWNLSSFDGLEVVILTPPKKTPPTSQPSADSAGEEENKEEGEERIYSIVLKDCITRGQPDAGREISWEWSFKPVYPPEEEEVKEYDYFPRDKSKHTMQKFRVEWKDFQANYRGRPVDEGEGLDPKSIKRFSIMIRSFFQTQQDGNFSVSIISISAVSKKKKHEISLIDNIEQIDEARDICPIPAKKRRRGQYFDEYDPEVDGQGDESGNFKDEDKSRSGSGLLAWLCGLGWW